MAHPREGERMEEEIDFDVPDNVIWESEDQLISWAIAEYEEPDSERAPDAFELEQLGYKEIEEPQPFDPEEEDNSILETTTPRPAYELDLIYEDNDAKFNGKDVQGLATIIQRENHFVTDKFSRDLYVFINHGLLGGTYIEATESIELALKQIVQTLDLSPKWTGLTKGREIYKWINRGLPLMDVPELRHINVGNGLLYLSPKGELFHFEPDWNYEYVTTIKLAASYDPKAACPTWEKFVSEVFPEDSQHIAWELIALLMVPIKNKSASAMVLKGPKNTGKSTFQNAIRAFIGEANIANLSLEQFGERFQTAQLKDKLVNVVGELPNSKLNAKTVNVLKQLIGNDMLSGEIKNGPSFKFQSYARCLFSCNEMPTCDSDEAFFDRFAIIPFRRKQFTKDPMKELEINEALTSPEELSGLLNKALAVLPKVVKDGIRSTSSMKQELEEIITDNDPLHAWAGQYLELGEDFEVAKDKLRDHYRLKEPNDFKRKSDKVFGRDLKKILPQLVTRQKLMADGARPYFYIGVKLAEEAEEQPEPELEFDLETLNEE